MPSASSRRVMHLPSREQKERPHDEILETKLAPSFISGSLLKRSRLFARMSANPQATLTLVYGAAGSGKSSLLYDFLKAEQAEAAWYTLEETDRDAKVFLRYFLAAIGRRHPEVTREASAKLAAALSVAQEWKNILTPLLNRMAAYKKDVWIVLDDYHRLEYTPSVTEIMEFLLLHAPRNFRCFIASRNLPKLPLAYLKSKNALTVLYPGDLKLDSAEIRLLFKKVWKLPLSDASLEMISVKTEGWFAAARLMAQAIENKSREQAEQYLEKLNLKDDFIYDYLTEEIYLLQPEPIRNFLKRTSILSSFNKDLSQCVTGLTQAGEIIGKLEELNLFIIHLDEKGEWFRYHHLFSEFLRTMLSKEEARPAIKRLHLRAGEWHERHKNAGEAIEHYLLAEEYAAAARLVVAEGPSLFQQGMLTSLLKWIAAIPRNVLDKSPDLLLLEGQLHDAAGSWEKGVAAYERALSILREEGTPDRISGVMEKLIVCLIHYGEYTKVLRYCREALDICGQENQGLRARLLSWYGVASVVQGNTEWGNGYKMLKRGFILAYDSGDADAIATACISYGFGYHFPQGNFDEARQVFTEGSELLIRMGFQYLACNQIMNKAVVEIYGGLFEEAERTLDAVERMASQYDLHFVNQGVLIARLILAIRQKKIAEAESLSALVTQQSVPLQLRPWYNSSVAMLRAYQGNLQQAMVAAQEMLNQLKLVGGGMYAPECYLTLGFIGWKNNSEHQTRRWFEEALTVARRGEMKYWLMKSHYALAGYLASLGFASIDFQEHYHLALKLTRENNYHHAWELDPFGFTAPILLEAFRVEAEPEGTKEIILAAKATLVPALEKISKSGGAQRQLITKMLKTFFPEDFPGAMAAPKTPRIRIAGPQPLTIKSLGGFSASRGGVEIQNAEWQRPKALKIFKYLLAFYPRDVFADELIENFWPETSVEDARHNLSMHVTYIRKALSPNAGKRDEGFIQGRPEIYRLCLRPIDTLDWFEFQSTIKQAEESWKKGERDDAISTYKSAIQLYTGNFLEEEIYAEWVQEPREKLKRQYLLALERTGSYHQSRSELREAVEFYHAYLQVQPLHEKILQATFRCLTAIGDKAGLKKEYEQYLSVMRRDFAEETPSSLDDLLARIPQGR